MIRKRKTMGIIGAVGALAVAGSAIFGATQYVSAQGDAPDVVGDGFSIYVNEPVEGSEWSVTMEQWREWDGEGRYRRATGDDPHNAVQDFEQAITFDPNNDGSQYPYIVFDQHLLVGRIGSELTGTSGSDFLEGGTHNDTLNGLQGSDVLTGHGGADIINGGPGNDYLFAQGLAGGELDNYVNELNGGIDHDIIVGSYGNDYITTGIGFDKVAGGPGVDTIEFVNHYNYSQWFGDVVPANETLFGFAKSLIYGQEGNDHIVGYVDNYWGDASSPTLLPSSIPESQRWHKSGQYQSYGEIYGGSGSDTIELAGRYAGVVYGGTGTDTISLTKRNLSDGTLHDNSDWNSRCFHPAPKTVAFYGNPGPDTITNTTNCYSDIDGGRGDDTIVIRGGHTNYYALDDDPPNNEVHSTQGLKSKIYGGSGNNTIEVLEPASHTAVPAAPAAWGNSIDGEVYPPSVVLHYDVETRGHDVVTGFDPRYTRIAVSGRVIVDPILLDGVHSVILHPHSTNEDGFSSDETSMVIKGVTSIPAGAYISP